MYDGHRIDGGDCLFVALSTQVAITGNVCIACLVTAAALARLKWSVLCTLKHRQAARLRCVRIVAGHTVATRGLDSGNNVHGPPAIGLGVVTGSTQLRRGQLEHRGIVRSMPIMTRKAPLLNCTMPRFRGQPFS
jgi:hypothetical protein